MNGKQGKEWPTRVGWFSPVRKGYQMKCCGCGHVNIIDFRLKKCPGNYNIIQMRVR